MLRVAFGDQFGEVTNDFAGYLVPEEGAGVDLSGGVLAVASHCSKRIYQVSPSLGC